VSLIHYYTVINQTQPLIRIINYLFIAP
jgi:hypothetical protein